jgi:hypothetical protein
MFGIPTSLARPPDRDEDRADEPGQQASEV